MHFKQLETLPYPVIVQFKEKHCDLFYIANSKNHLLDICLFRFNVLYNSGWYDGINDETFSNDTYIKQTGDTAFEFLQSRCHYEYEEMEIIIPDSIAVL